MTEFEPKSGRYIGELYDQQVKEYTAFAEDSYTWKYLERPAFDHYIPDLFTSETRVLDLGCGTGRVLKHLIARGINANNVVGLDVSHKLIEEAHKAIPKATFIQTSSDEFELPLESFDLVTTNMVIHYLDNSTLEHTLERIYRVLKPNGVYFFVESDPDHNEQGKIAENVNQWLIQPTPWGTVIPYFNRDPRTLLTNFLDIHGFNYESGWTLKVSEAGRVDPEKYIRYSSRPSRIAARYKKVGERIKDMRNNLNCRIPNLSE